MKFCDGEWMTGGMISGLVVCVGVQARLNLGWLGRLDAREVLAHILACSE